MIPEICGASPRPEGNPSLPGTKGGYRFQSAGSFSEKLSGALPKSLGNPSPQTMDEGRRLTQAKAKIDEYAAFFVQQMMQAMRATIQPSGLVARGRGEEIFQGELDNLFSAQMAKSFRFSKAFGPSLERFGKQDPPGVQEGSRVA